MTKRKANTPIKRKQMIARTALKNLCIAMVLGEGKVLHGNELQIV
ncbi:hypothetical protein [Alteromonas sp. IB21]|nr:hypothetical protein [Alteromonas sp. IB21]